MHTKCSMSYLDHIMNLYMANCQLQWLIWHAYSHVSIHLITERNEVPEYESSSTHRQDDVGLSISAIVKPQFLVDEVCNLYYHHTVHSESRCALRLWYVDLVVSIEVAVEVCCCFTVLKQQFKCNTGKVCNCSIQFLLSLVCGHHFQQLL
jgi:hypothetical protein